MSRVLRNRITNEGVVGEIDRTEVLIQSEELVASKLPEEGEGKGQNEGEHSPGRNKSKLIGPKRPMITLRYLRLGVLWRGKTRGRRVKSEQMQTTISKNFVQSKKITINQK